MTTTNTNTKVYAYSKNFLGIYSLYRFADDQTRADVLNWKNGRGYATNACTEEEAREIAHKMGCGHWERDIALTGERLPYAYWKVS